MHSPSWPNWPNNSRVAIIVSVLFESWGEGKHPAYFPRTTPLKPGAPDLSARRWSELGGNEGIWPFARTIFPGLGVTFDRCGIDVALVGRAFESTDHSDNRERTGQCASIA